MASRLRYARATVWALISSCPGRTDPQQPFRQNLRDLWADRTCEPIPRTRTGRFVRRLVVEGVLVPIRTKTSTSYDVTCSVLHQRGRGWSHSAQCRETESSTECSSTYASHPHNKRSSYRRCSHRKTSNCRRDCALSAASSRPTKMLPLRDLFRT